MRKRRPTLTPVLVDTTGRATTDLERRLKALEAGGGGGGGATNLSYTASAGGGTVNSDTGGDASVPLADGTNAGLMAPAQHTKLAGVASGATANDTDANLRARSSHTGTQSADTLTDGTTNKAFLATERTKLAGVATGATANDTDANLKARANHTGTQSIATILAAASARFFGRITASGGAGEELTGTQATTLLDVFTSALKGLVPASGGGTSNFLRADGTWATPSGGSDPWTYIKLGSDFVTGSATAVNITGLEFTPAANKSYEFEAVLLTRTATATTGPRPGVAWPTGLTDGVVEIYQPTAAGTQVMQFGNSNAAVLAPVGGLPNTTQSYKATVIGMVIAGASPSGTVKIQLASETAATNVTAKAGSYLKYREI